VDLLHWFSAFVDAQEPDRCATSWSPRGQRDTRSTARLDLIRPLGLIDIDSTGRHVGGSRFQYRARAISG